MNIPRADEPAKRHIPRYRPTTTPVFVQLPRHVLGHPPIRHRGDPPEVGLTVFEFAIAGAVLILARASVAQARHDAGLAGGRDAIKKKRRSASREMAQFRMGGISYEFKLAGSSGYMSGVDAFDRGQLPGAVYVETSRSELLRIAGLARNGRHVAALSGALWRLAQPVRTAHDPLPSILSRRRTLDDGRLRLTVRPEWLPTSRFGRVPWPLPTRGSGSTAVALHLMLAGMDLRQTSRTTMDAAKMVERLGMLARWSMEMDRALTAALTTVNGHLATLDVAALEDAGIPTAFDILPAGDGGRVRVVAADADPAYGAQEDPPSPEAGNDDDEAREVQRQRHDRRRRDQQRRADQREFADVLDRLRSA